MCALHMEPSAGLTYAAPSHDAVIITEESSGDMEDGENKIKHVMK